MNKNKENKEIGGAHYCMHKDQVMLGPGSDKRIILSGDVDYKGDIVSAVDILIYPDNIGGGEYTG